MVGNTPNYNKLDIIKALIYIDKHVSRLKLKQMLGLGEGTIRTILNILKKKKLISSTRQGHSLTVKGKKLTDKINNSIDIKEFKSSNIYAKYKKIALLIKNIHRVVVGYIERDIAVKAGAEGAMLFVYKGNKLIMPQMKGVYFKELEKLFNYKKDNILVITFADSKRIAENSALAVVLELKKTLIKI